MGLFCNKGKLHRNSLSFENEINNKDPTDYIYLLLRKDGRLRYVFIFLKPSRLLDYCEVLLNVFRQMLCWVFHYLKRHF